MNRRIRIAIAIAHGIAHSAWDVLRIAGSGSRDPQGIAGSVGPSRTATTHHGWNQWLQDRALWHTEQPRPLDLTAVSRFACLLIHVGHKLLLPACWFRTLPHRWPWWSAPLITTVYDKPTRKIARACAYFVCHGPQCGFRSAPFTATRL